MSRSKWQLLPKHHNSAWTGERACVFEGWAENVQFFHSLESIVEKQLVMSLVNSGGNSFLSCSVNALLWKKKNICLLTARRTPFLQHFISKMFSASSHLDIVLLTRMIFFPRRKCVVNTGTFGPGAEWSVKEDELKIRCSPTDGAKLGIRVRPLHAWVTHFHSVTVYAALRGINGHCFTDEFYCVWTSADLYP